MADQTYVEISSYKEPALYVAGLLNGYLRAGKRVLVLLPGGSSIRVAAAACQLLDQSYAARLSFTLTDERYGPVGHVDSNWQQLLDAGVSFDAASQQHPVLTGASMEQTVANFGAALQREMQAADVVFGIFGMGEDGHTAGALPGSPAITSDAFAVGYDGGAYRRITMTLRAIGSVTDAILFVMGENKRTQLAQLQTPVALDVQPAQSLKKIPRLLVFSDTTGEAL